MKTLAIVLSLACATVLHAGSLTAHIGCIGSLGVERACAGDTVTCVSLAKTSDAHRITSLVTHYHVLNTDETSEPIERLGLPTTIRLPLGLPTLPPTGESDVVYVTQTGTDDFGRYQLFAVLRGQVQTDPTRWPDLWLDWSASYGLSIALVDCAISGEARLAHPLSLLNSPAMRWHKMRTRRVVRP